MRGRAAALVAADRFGGWMKIPAWIRTNLRMKLTVLGIIFATGFLYAGWRDLAAEARAFLEYKKEHLEKLNCYPTWKGDGGKGV